MFALVLAFVLSGSTIFATLAGSTTFAFSAVFAYIYFGAMTAELGGRPLPLGHPIQH